MNNKRIFIYIFLIVIIVGIFYSRNIRKNKEIINDETEKITEISDIYDIYKTIELNDYKDIRNLPQNYNTEQAKKDNCFVIGAMVHNDNLYTEFNDRYKNKKNAFIRVAENTTEGDLVVTDIYYDAIKDKIYLLHDSTRDNFSSESDRIIKTYSFEKTGEWTYENRLYWIAYNGNISDLTINSDKLYVISIIN